MASICFVNYDNYPVLNPAFGNSYIGGESVQQTLLAREFVRRGWDVSMICGDFGQPDGEVIDEIKVYKTYKPSAGLPVLRFVYPRVYSIWQALRRADADVYYQSCAGAVTGITAYYSRSNNKRMIFRIAHDSDCMPGQQLIRFARDRKIYEYGLRSADLVCAQSEYQQGLLEEKYGRASTIVKMVVEHPGDMPELRDVDVLWVNNIRDFKRPDVLLEIAGRMPEVKFTMIGGPVSGFEDLYRKIESQAKSIPNLNFLGAVPYAEVNQYYSRAKLFLNTSDSEGFPNSFLQSWIRSVPVVSFFDPDSVIGRHGLGESPNNIDDAVGKICKLLDNDDRRERAAQSSQSFAEKNFSSEAVGAHYESLIREMRDS